MRQIITQPKELIGKFVAILQGRNEPWGNYTAIGLTEDDALIAGVIYNNFGGAGVCAHIAAIKGSNWCSRSYLRAIFEYPFIQLGKRRMTALVAKKNRRSRTFVEALGFKMEGSLRHALADDDVLLYGMLSGECRWISRDSCRRSGRARQTRTMTASTTI